MTRYLFGIFAVAFAFATVAFKTPEKKYAIKLFRYTAPSGSYASSDVQNKSNWAYISSGSQNCPANVVQKACEMQVDAAQVNPDNTLKSTFSIPVAEYLSTGKFYVTTPAGATPFNKSL